MKLKSGLLLSLSGALALAASFPSAGLAKDTVKLAFIGPLSGGNSAPGLGGRNSAQLAVQLRNADPAAKYTYELVPFDDECKPNVGIQVATKAAADNSIIAGITHYCSAVGIATVDIYSRFGLPVVVWGAILPEITYGNDYREIHRVNGTMINEGRLAADFLTKQGYKKFVVVHDTTDYGKGQNKYFTEYLKPTGGEIFATFPTRGFGSGSYPFSSWVPACWAEAPCCLSRRYHHYFTDFLRGANRVLTATWASQPF